MKFRGNSGGYVDIFKFTANGGTGQVNLGAMWSSYFLSLYSGGSESVRITTAGNVGIGSIVPQNILDVNGTITTTGLASRSTTANLVLTTPANASAGSGNINLTPGSFFVGNNATVGGVNIIAGNNSMNANGGNVVFGGSIAITAGNETGSPASNPTVGGSITLTAGQATAVSGLHTGGQIVLKAGDATSATMIQIGNYSGVGNEKMMGFFGATPVAQQGATTDLRQALINLGFYTTGGATPLNLNGGNFTTTGTGTFGSNVGIGSISPSQLLDVNGTVRMVGFVMTKSPSSGYVLTSDNNGNGTWAPGGGSGNGWTEVNTNVTSTGTNVGIGTSVPASLFDVNRKFNILSNGNVGIGTLVPGQKLQVNGNIELAHQTLSDDANYVYFSGRGLGWSSYGSNQLLIDYDPGTTNLSFNMPTSSGMAFQGFGAAQMAKTIFNSAVSNFTGNVGIGSAQPQYALDVASKLLFDSSGNIYGSRTDNPTGIDQNGGQSLWLGAAENYQLRLDTSGLTEITGRVLVNNSSDDTTSALQVNGVAKVGSSSSIDFAQLYVNPNNYGQSQIRGTDFAFFDNVPYGGGLAMGAYYQSYGSGWVSTSSAGSYLGMGDDGSISLSTFTGATPGDAFTTDGVNFKTYVQANDGVGVRIGSRSGAIGGDDTTSALQVNGDVDITGNYYSNGSPISGGAGAWSTGSGTIYETGSTVGIGLSSPVFPLEINGTAGANPSLGIVETTASAPVWLRVDQSAAGSAFELGIAGASGQFLTDAPAGAAIFKNFGSSVVGMGFGGGTSPNSTLYLKWNGSNAGNVGIGNASPAVKLDIDNITGNQDVVHIFASGMTSGQNVQFDLGKSASNYKTATFRYYDGEGTASASRIAIGHYGDNLDTNGLNMLGGGNVGIDSASPGATLDVKGTVRMTGFVMTKSPSSGYVLTSDASGNGSWSPGGGSGTIASGTAGQEAIYTGSTALGSGVITDNGTNVGIGTSTALNAKLTVNGGITSLGSGNTTLNVGGGNVGIASASPGALLDIKGSSDIVQMRVQSNGTQTSHVFDYIKSDGSTNMLYLTDAGNLFLYNWMFSTAFATSNGSAGGPTFTFTNDQSTGFYHPAASSLSLVTAGADRLYINSIGNVGIGSTLPAQILDVNGTVRMTGFVMTKSPSSGYVLTSDNNGNGTWSPAASSGGGSGTVNNGTINQVARYASTGTGVSGSSILYDNGTNVGIGSVSPAQMLDVNGSVRIGTPSHKVQLILNTADADLTKGLVVSEGSAGQGYLIDPYEIEAVTVDATGAPTAWNKDMYMQYKSSGKLFLMQGGGKISVGTDGGTPSLFNVSGNATIGSTSVAGNHAGPTDGLLVGGNISIGANSSVNKLDVNGSAAIGSYGGSNAAPTNGLIVSGNVGIGSASPAAKLDVQGSLYVNGFVGIGAANPTVPLNIATSGGSGYSITAAGAIGAGVINSNSYFQNLTGGGSGILESINGAAGGGWEFANGSGGGYDTGISRISAGALGIGNGTAGNVTGTLIAANVGISSSTPSHVLEVQGSVYLNGNVGIGTTTPGVALQVKNTITLSSEYANTCTTSLALNWNNGNKQKVTLTNGNTCAITFTAPTGGVGNFLLKLIQGSAGTSLATWAAASGSVKWAGGAAPTLTATNAAVDIVSCYWDGTNYYCASSLNFS
ncbi:MAG: hypothetical protein HQL14_07100 [Candidatus Omnitrophica bacterium]|nr:hypothetical protein [Candidatus Omnitrophota bacterium]